MARVLYLLHVFRREIPDLAGAGMGPERGSGKGDTSKINTTELAVGSLIPPTDKKMGDSGRAGAPGKSRGMGPGSVGNTPEIRDQQVVGGSKQ